MPRLDIGFRRRVWPRHSGATGAAASRLYPASVPGGSFLRPEFDIGAGIVVDLGRSRVIGEVALWTREAVPTDIVSEAPLVIATSEDGVGWQDVARSDNPVAAGDARNAWQVAFPSGLRAAFLLISVPEEYRPFLNYIEIVQFVPKLAWGSSANLSIDGAGRVSCEYVFQTNYGLYSGVSTVLQDVITLCRSGIAVRTVDLVRGFQNFKDQPDQDVYPAFFAGIGNELLTACQDVSFDSWDIHKPYRDLPLAALNRVAAELFPPSAGVRARMETMMRQSGVVPESCVAIVYRGTDKGSEVTLAPIEAYIAATRAILAAHPDLHVLIQTDQEQARDAVLAAFGDRCRFFSAMPVTGGDVAIHNLRFGLDVPMQREEFAARMMAAALIASRCAHVVAHTGNVGAWIAIYRGSAANLSQFDRNGDFVPPPP